MPLPEIEEILQKYKIEEQRIEKLIAQMGLRKETFEENKISEAITNTKKNLHQVKSRNKSILQELESVKANLRSKAIFSPAEMQWEKICKRYRDEPSLPVTTWKCNHPVYV